jgi:hypothetical protein
VQKLFNTPNESSLIILSYIYPRLLHSTQGCDKSGVTEPKKRAQTCFLYSILLPIKLKVCDQIGYLCQ